MIFRDRQDYFGSLLMNCSLISKPEALDEHEFVAIPAPTFVADVGPVRAHKSCLSNPVGVSINPIMFGGTARSSAANDGPSSQGHGRESGTQGQSLRMKGISHFAGGWGFSAFGCSSPSADRRRTLSISARGTRLTEVTETARHTKADDYDQRDD